MIFFSQFFLVAEFTCGIVALATLIPYLNTNSVHIQCVVKQKDTNG